MRVTTITKGVTTITVEVTIITEWVTTRRTLQEKRLIIDVMSLRQSYERREVTKIMWIHGHNNLANSMTKTKPSSALKTVIDTNRIKLDMTKKVERAAGTKKKKELKRI